MRMGKASFIIAVTLSASPSVIRAQGLGIEETDSIDEGKIQGIPKVTVDSLNQNPGECVGGTCPNRPWCGTAPVSREAAELASDQFQEWQTAKAENAMGPANLVDTGCAERGDCVNWNYEVITIPTWIHVIHDGDNGTEFIYENNSTYIDQQMRVMNNAFAAGPPLYDEFENGARSYPKFRQQDADIRVRFCLKGTTATENAKWYNNATEYSDEFKDALHEGGKETLNAWYIDLPYIGEATFPDWTDETNFTLDGVIIRNTAFPGGGGNGYDEGDTLVHEVGHWLNLEHPFARGCDGPGDYMDDAPPSIYYDSITRYESDFVSTLFTCFVGLDDCSETGYKSPIHNYMSYRDDDCLQEFSPAQKERMQAAWEIYRHKEDYSKKWGVADDGTCCYISGVECSQDSECCSGNCASSWSSYTKTCSGGFGF